jgi:hypothetical protein
VSRCRSEIGAAGDLDTLRAEAVRRGTTLSKVLAEAVAEKAAALRRRRRLASRRRPFY